MVEMTIDSIRMSMMNYQRVIILKEKIGARFLPIWIGPAEADAITLKLQDVTTPRPLTHDLLRSMLEALGARVNFVFVNDLKSDTFYARIVLAVNGSTLEVDSRPSDAIALAVRTRSPIYVDEAVIDKAGIILDKETGKPLPADQAGKIDAGGEKKPVSEEELRRLSAFSDFISTLDLKDLDKDKDKPSS